MRPPRAQGVLVGGFVAVCVISGLLLYALGGGTLPGKSYYRVQAVVPTAVALVPNADVREAGVHVGKVAAIAGRGGNSVLALDIDKNQAPVYRDATVAVRLKSLVGENYVEIDPGHRNAGALRSGGVLPIQNAAPETQLDQILSALPHRIRQRLQVLLDGLGGGLSGHGADLNRFFGSTAALVDSSHPTVAVLAKQRKQVSDLIEYLGRVMSAIGDRGQAVQVLARQGKAAAQAVAARDDKLAQIIDRLPSTLRQLAATTGHLGAFSGRARPVLANLRTAFMGLAPVVRRLRPAALEARTTLRRLGQFSVRGVPLLDSLRSFSHSATPAIRPLDAMLDQLNPLLDYLSPYARDISAFFSNTRSATGYYDATGHLARVLGLFAPDSLPVFTPAQAQAFDALVKAGGLTPVLTHGTNAYPAPGAIGHFTPFSGSYPRVEALPPAVG